MRILLLKAGRLFVNTGGGIESQKIYYSLERLSNDNKNIEFKCISAEDENNIFLKKFNKTRIKDYLSRCFFHSSFLFIDWQFSSLKKTIVKFNPDIIVLVNSRLGFIAKHLKKNLPRVHVIGHFDNIEYDYVDGVFVEKKGMINYIFKKIEKISVKLDESNFIKNIDTAVFLTERDLFRAQELYGGQVNNPKIVPICIKKSNKKLYISNEPTVNLVFLGSLWYMSNIHAIKWFLENVWNEILKINKDVMFIIGGSNPSDKFRKYLNKYKNIKLYANFNKKEDIIPRNSIFISPILTGAGMKVKVAEALEMGLMIIGSHESLIGYSEALNDIENNNIIVQADTVTEYKEAIFKAIENLNDLNNIRSKSMSLYEKYYSIDRAYHDIKVIIDSIRNRTLKERI